MSVEALKATLEEEKRDGNSLSRSLPFHYVEICHLLFNNASDNIEDVDRVRMLIEDIQDVRMSKVRNGVNMMLTDAAKKVPAFRITGVSHMELNMIRRV